MAVYYQQDKGPCYAEGCREFMLALRIKETIHHQGYLEQAPDESLEESLAGERQLAKGVGLPEEDQKEKFQQHYQEGEKEAEGHLEGRRRLYIEAAGSCRKDGNEGNGVHGYEKDCLL